MKLSHRETAQEIFEQLEYRAENYILIHFNAFVSDTPNGIKIKCDDEEWFGPHDSWYHQLVGKSIDVSQLQAVLLDTDWSEYFKNVKEGLYEFKVLLSIESDSDDYRTWFYYVMEHIEYEYVCSLDFHLAQLEEFKTLTSEDLFSF